MKNSIIIISTIVLIIFSCKKETKQPVFDREMNDSIVVSTQNNHVENRLDSIGFIEFITEQKLQDVYDLLCWSIRNKQDTLTQHRLASYFYEEDTTSIYKLRKELDSVQTCYTKVAKIEILEKDSLESDTIGKINFVTHYFDVDKKYQTTVEKSATYYLKSKPKKLKNEFTFYFSNISEKDTVRKGVTQ